MANDKTIQEYGYQVLYSEHFSIDDLNTIIGGQLPTYKKKLHSIIEDLQQNKHTNQGKVKLIKGNGGVKYFRAKLNDSDRLLFTTTKYNGQDALIVLELILKHDYDKSKYLNNREKIKNIQILDFDGQKIPTNDMELRYSPQMHWLGKFLTFDSRQEDIVENQDGRYNLPLIVSGHAGSGKTSVALEKLRKLEDQFDDGKILFITQSENLIKKSKQLYEYEHWNESKLITKVQERIEFTSVHQFITQKIAKINKKIGNLVEGKQPITRNEFFHWFRQQCEKGKFKKYKNQGDKLYEEFTAVIAGGNLAAEGGESKYIDLGLRESIFSKAERKKIYDFFQEYKQFVANHSQFYDTSLIAGECLEMVDKLYDVIIVDEVQDLTRNTLNMILASLKDEFKNNFLLCGDVNQVIHPSFFSISKLKNFLAQNMLNNDVLKICPLEENYRNSQHIINLANRILHLKNYCFASEDKMSPERNPFFMKSATGNQGEVHFLTTKNEDLIENITKNIKKSVNWAQLILHENSRQSAEQKFGNQHVFSLQEAKGFEYKNVVLYMFDETYDKIWPIACTSKKLEDIKQTIDEIRSSYDQRKVIYSRFKDKEDRSFEENKFFINALYVAVTRAIDKVYILSQSDSGAEHPLLKVLKDEEDKPQALNVQVEESTPEKWKEEAIKLIDNGVTRQAKNIAISLLDTNKAEYSKIIALKLIERQERGFGEEIMTQLKNRGYDDEFNQVYSASTKTNMERETGLDPAFLKQSLKSTTGRDKTSSSSKQDEKLKSSSNENSPNQKNKDAKLQAVKQKVELKMAPKIIQSSKCSESSASYKYNKILNKRPSHNEKLIKELFENKHLVHMIIEDKIKTFKKSYPKYKHLRQEIFSLCVQRISVKIVDYLLTDFTPQHVDLKAIESFGFLAEVVFEGYKNILQFLIDRGVDVNAKTPTGHCTLLHGATRKEHSDIVELLLKSGSDPNAMDERSMSALYISLLFNNIKIAELLLNYGADVDAKWDNDYTVLHMSAEKGLVEMTELLLSKGANTEVKENRSFTPLHLAVLHGNYDVIQLLLDYGADINAQYRNGFNPLRLAIEKKNIEVIRLLLDRGADVNKKLIIERRDDNGLMEKFCTTILHVAISKNCPDIVMYLIKHGADTCFQDDHFITPLYLAARLGSKDIVDMLLENGAYATINSNNIYGETPLHIATKMNRKDVVRMLLNRGANINAVEDQNLTPLHYARMRHDGDIARMLLEHGANFTHVLAIQGGTF